MADQHRGRRVVVYLGDALDEVVSARLKKSGQKLSEFVRDAIAAHVQRPELSAVPQGRPKKEASPEPSSPRKKAVAATGRVVSAPKKAARKVSK